MASLDECVSRYFPDGSVLAADLNGGVDPACLKLIASKLLGVSIVFGSAVVALPQLLTIVSARSMQGFSPTSITLDLVTTIANFSYFAPLGYAFTTWGEHVFLLLQAAVMFVLYFHYNGAFGLRFMFAAVAMAGFGAVLYTRALPDLPIPAPLCAALGLPRCNLSCEDLSGSLPIVLSFGSRLPQIVQNARQGHTGQLSLVTYFLNTMGGGMRVFTTLQELNDPLTLASVTASLLQNAAVLLQIVAYYGRSGSAEKKKAE